MTLPVAVASQHAAALDTAKAIAKALEERRAAPATSVRTGLWLAKGQGSRETVRETVVAKLERRGTAL